MFLLKKIHLKEKINLASNIYLFISMRGTNIMIKKRDKHVKMQRSNLMKAKLEPVLIGTQMLNSFIFGD